ncbi:MAG: HD domain-containing protein [Pseudomonadales bacterium]|nr:HD domain-containing protein [Pseudomonadales bacterium]
MSNLIQQAMEYAIQAHTRIDQRRKYTNQPYDIHLRQVAGLVAEVTDDPQMIAAAWLHDTVEDTPATLLDIEELFGADVAQLVSDLTDVSRPSDGNRALRKAIDRSHIAQASPRAKTIKLADLIDNCQDICSHDERFGQVYLAEMEALLRVLDSGDERLLKRAHKAWKKSRDKINLNRDQHIQDIDLEFDQAPNTGFEQARSLRHFTESFSAQDIAEPLGSFDNDTSAIKASEIMLSNNWYVAGLRQDGLVEGYILRNDLERGHCGDYLREFTRDQVVTADSSFSDVIHVLTRRRSCFVSQLGGISGIVTREHIQKPIARMWLFGMVTITEISLVNRIEEHFPDESWISRLAESRLEKARQIHAERARREQHCKLVDCLQFSDKAQILLKDNSQLEWMGFDSRRVAKKVVKDLESLRNNLAHSQDIVSHDWAQIARMTQRIETSLGTIYG